MWAKRIGLLQAGFLEDKDDIVDMTADLPRDDAGEIRRILGISDEYVLTIPDDPTEGTIRRRLTELHGLLRSVVSRPSVAANSTDAL